MCSFNIFYKCNKLTQKHWLISNFLSCEHLIYNAYDVVTFAYVFYVPADENGLSLS